MKRLRYQLSISLAPLFFRVFSFFLFAGCRVKRRNYHHLTDFVDGGRPFILSFWHYGVIYIVHAEGGNRPYAAMVSPSKDGEYISRILQAKGYMTVRGSRTGGGIGALKGLLRLIRKGRIAVLVADGSQGPARKAQAGAVLLASRTGVPIIPMTWGASRYFSFRSWDRTAFPLPFARVVMDYGEPIQVPANLDQQGIEQYRNQLEDSLERLYADSWGYFGKKEH